MSYPIYSYSQITKTKLIYPLALCDVKRHLRMDNDFTDDDDYLENLIVAGTTIAENYIEKDIAKTYNELRTNGYFYNDLKIREGNFLGVVSVSDNNLAAIGTVNRTIVGDDYFQINWDSDISSDPLYVSFYTGYNEDETPPLIKQCILIIIADLYDNQRSNINWSGLTDNKVWQTLLDRYRIIRF